MFQINENFARLQGNYLFSEVARRVAAFAADHPEADLIRLGIGDVTCPLPEAVVRAMHAAVDEMGTASGFHGYGPEQGYAFLREAIAEHDYRARGIDISADEIFLSDGAKCDTGNIGDILSADCIVAVTDPVYPVYVDTNVMAGRSGEFDPKTGRFSRIVYLPATEENNFLPALPTEPVDVVYLCYPNNPTGTALTFAELKPWVDWANANGTLLLFDAAYERFITQENIPHSIFEIEGAKTCAIEFRSFSKTAGFTGTRCAFTVVPKELVGHDRQGQPHSLHALWSRRQTTKFNGVSYPVQRAAAAIYTPEGKAECDALISHYLENAAIIRKGLSACGLSAYGGVNSPYVWLKTPHGMDSWAFFDALLQKAHVVGTPGSGFGAAGEGYFRLTAFNTTPRTQEALERIAQTNF